MCKKILIGGGSGLVGERLTQLLVSRGFEVSHLSRFKKNKDTPTVQWNLNTMQLKASDIEPFDGIINLAGAGIIDKSWTKERKQIIIDSRVNSTKLLAKTIRQNVKKPKAYISASAVGFYGLVSSEKIYSETDNSGSDFLADTCVLWEKSVREIEDIGIPTARIRIGIVLTKKGGALKAIAQPITYYLGAPLGSGRQYIPWIHLDDLCLLFIHVLENKLEGVYNAVAPQHTTNASFTKTLANVLKKPLYLPPVPAFVLKLMLGSRALLVLEGSKITAKKIMGTGFRFQYSKLEAALKNIYSE